MNVTCTDRGVDELGELDDAGLGHHGGPAGAVGGDGTVVPGEIGALHVAQAGSAVAGAGTTDEEKAHVLGGAGDQLAIEALADQESEAMVAKGPHSGEKAAMPEGVDGRGWHVEADGGTGFADMLVTESSAKAYGDNARNPGNDGKDDALLQGELLGH